jgi:hypothetical protein
MSAELILITLTLPILFAIHNLEEVIVYEYFMRKNQTKFRQKLPKFVSTKITKVAANHTTASFALGITVLTILFAIISYAAVLTNTHFAWLIWLAAALVLAWQLVVHVLSAIFWRGYAFGTITAVIFLPILVIMIKEFCTILTFSWAEIAIATIGVFVIGYVGGIAFLHGWLMKKFDAKFSNRKEKV